MDAPTDQPTEDRSTIHWIDKLTHGKKYKDATLNMAIATLSRAKRSKQDRGGQEASSRHFFVFHFYLFLFHVTASFL